MNWRRLKPEEKVEVAINMVDVVTQITAENERMKNPRITEASLIAALRRRFRLGRKGS